MRARSWSSHAVRYIIYLLADLDNGSLRSTNGEDSVASSAANLGDPRNLAGEPGLGGDPATTFLASSSHSWVSLLVCFVAPPLSSSSFFALPPPRSYVRRSTFTLPKNQSFMKSVRSGRGSPRLAAPRFCDFIAESSSCSMRKEAQHHLSRLAACTQCRSGNSTYLWWRWNRWWGVGCRRVGLVLYALWLTLQCRERPAGCLLMRWSYKFRDHLTDYNHDIIFKNILKNYMGYLSLFFDVWFICWICLNLNLNN